MKRIKNVTISRNELIAVDDQFEFKMHFID